jgi:C1A family cysteine protease
MPIDINAIQSAVLEKKAKWVARPNPAFIGLSDDQLRRRLGVILDEQKLSALRTATPPELARVIAHFETARATPLENRAAVGREAVSSVADRLRLAEQITTTVAKTPALHATSPVTQSLLQVDWRNRKGRNNVTPVKDQGGCGSCVSFGCTAMLESMVLVEHNVSLDLSEAELLFCGGGGCGGWWPDSAVTYIKNRGVALESCFPYQDHDMPCNTCSERDGEAIQAVNSVVYFASGDRRGYLCCVGPVACVFEVYDDFFSYSGGVYSHVTGGLAGLHCVEVIGFDDVNSFWICKNSWGTGWGENGFFCIAYGQCNIDGNYPFWGVYGTRWYGT